MIISNKAKCLKCGDTIESKHRHDFVACSCGNIFVDGGKSYIRRGGPCLMSGLGEGEPPTYVEMSEVEDDNTGP